MINYYICPQYKTQERCAFLAESAGVSCQYADYEKVSTECRLWREGTPFLLPEVSSGALSGLPYYVGITLLATEKDMK